MRALLQPAPGHVATPRRHGRRTRGCVACVSGGTDRVYPCATPHSGYHFDGQPRKFFEGWYFRVTLPSRPGAEGAADSFAIMYSIEDPLQTGARSGVGAQVMGPGDEYIIQHSRGAVSTFWAAPHALELGATFSTHSLGVCAPAPSGMVDASVFDDTVVEGFQASAVWGQGRLRADSATAGSGPASTVGRASWSFSVTPRAGWGGGPGQKQQATAGWLAALPVFEPHWQVLMAHGLATGWLQWGDTRYEFSEAPFYSEKNWGGAFPRKWFWVQCNSWDGAPGLAVTCAGAVRDLPLLRLTENVGLLGIHIPEALLTPGGAPDAFVFIELVPTTGVLDWTVAPWGSWRVHGRNKRWEASLVAECAPDAGTPLRAPTADRGLAAACKDTFAGRATLCVWDRTQAAGSGPVLRATSTQAALETGGGPWFETWTARSKMREPLRSATLVPVDVDALRQVFPQWDPPGL